MFYNIPERPFFLSFFNLGDWMENSVFILWFSIIDVSFTFQEFFENPAFRADGLKLYPTLVIRGTGIYYYNTIRSEM